MLRFLQDLEAVTGCKAKACKMAPKDVERQNESLTSQKLNACKSCDSDGALDWHRETIWAEDK